MKRVNKLPKTTESVAIVGMQGRFPGANNVQELWENLKNGVESISSFSEAELKAAGIDPSFINVPGYVNRGCPIDDIDQFDAGFFGYSARDAETMDPQQRIFLECAWECLEQAGCDPDSYEGLIGVFAGSDQSSYIYQIYASVDLSAYGYGGMMPIGNEKDYLTTQVSYKLNLHGPSMAIQTSCSTSLVAVCMACQSLVHGYCDMAIAGGVGISIPQKKGYWYAPGGIVSPDGHCRPFDAAGQGTVIGNGIGIVVLKRLSEAIADGDQIHAVIKGFALNNDGSAKVGYTAPSVDGQAQVIRMAQEMAGVEPESIGYIETHGTATALGDPIEVAALTKAFKEKTNKRQYCAIGSLKSNVGHLSSAAGISGLIKGVLVVKNGQIPKSLHYEQPNPQINFKDSPFFVASDLQDWPLQGQIRRAGVSSFGVGGTNAHIILEEAPKVEAGGPAADKQLLVLSARSPKALEKLTDNLVNQLEKTPELDLADVAFTTQVGRKSFSTRRTLVFDRNNREDLLTALRTRDPQRMLTAQTEMRERAVAFMFSGQGTQYVNMGRELYQTEETFRKHVDACCDILKAEMNLDLRQILYPSGDEAQATEQLKRTSITQPALFTIEYSLAQLWMEWGMTPKAMLGHSIGEYVAACLAGVMTLQEALSVVAMRGRLMDSMPGGSMLAVPLPESSLQAFLSPALSLAAVNAPSLCVLSGASQVIDTVEQQLASQGLPCRRLHTSHAFHSSMMEPVVRQFVDRLSRVNLRPPQIPYLSNVTGSWITAELATSPEYWGAHLRQTVRFADNLAELMIYPDLALIEVGPGQTLTMLAKQQGSRANSQLFVPSLPGPQEKDSDAELIRKSVGQLWLGGVRIDWRGLHEHGKRRIVPLPTYPFERQRFWIGPLDHSESADAIPAPEPPRAETNGSGISLTAPATTATVAAPAAQQSDISDWFYVPNWKQAVSTASAGAADDKGMWLVFQDSAGVGEAVVKHLRATGRRVNAVVRGDSFAAFDGGYRLRPGEKSDYESLVKELKDRGEYPARILHLWSADASPEGVSAVQAFEEAQSRSFYSLLYLAQALAKSGGSSQVHIGVVSDELYAVLGDEKLRSYEGTVCGICKVIPQEYPNLRCRLIDVTTTQAGLAESLIEELSRDQYDAVVAYRNGRRWVQEFEPLRLAQPDKKLPMFRDGGVYLITGGMGNIGLALAEAIAREVKAKLVLVGRTEFPERAQWDNYLASNPTDQKSARIRRLKAIEQAGAEVLVASGDVTEMAQMKRLVASVTERLGPINGVIHGAANLSPNAFLPLREVDQRNGSDHFRPKIHGLLFLEEILREEPPEFFVLLSSISAVLGGLGLTAYASSNAFLDAEAQRRNRDGSTNWISINWDAWDFSASATPEGTISGTQGQEAFRRIVAASLKHVVVSASPLATRLDKWVNLGRAQSRRVAAAAATHSPQPVSPFTTSSNGGNGNGAAHTRPDLSTQYVAPRSDTEKKITGVWEHLLGVQPIGVYDKFFELGGHSLLAIQLLAELREIFDLDLPVQRIFEAPTIAQLAESIEHDRRDTKAAEPALATSNGKDDDDRLLEMMKLVEGLSESELDALLNEAESMQKGEGNHG